MIYDLIIIGMGPGGISAGIYAKRNGLNVLMLEGKIPGGLLNTTSEVANYPGHKSMSGPQLAKEFLEHAKEVGVPYQMKKVTNILDNGNTKMVICGDEKFECKKIIIASGRKPRLLGLENEKELTGRGISYCALCDGALYKNKDVAIVGAGNTALEEALYLSDICNKVYLVHRGSALKGEQLLQERVYAKENIEIMYNSRVTKPNIEDGKLKNLVINDETELDVACLFIFVGYEPAVDFDDNNLIEKNAAGYIIVDKNYETNCSGIYAIGDIIVKKLYQIVTAASEGATAAINVTGAIKTNR